MFCKITVTYTSKSKVEVKLEYKLKIQTLFFTLGVFIAKIVVKHFRIDMYTTTAMIKDFFF